MGKIMHGVPLCILTSQHMKTKIQPVHIASMRDQTVGVEKMLCQDMETCKETHVEHAPMNGATQATHEPTVTERKGGAEFKIIVHDESYRLTQLNQ